MNGRDHPSRSVHVFHVGKMRMKLCRGWITKSREIYSSSMQVKVVMFEKGKILHKTEKK